MKYNNHTPKKEDKPQQEETLNEHVVAGRNAIIEALKSDTKLEKIFIVKGEHDGSIVRILAMAKEQKIPVQEADRVKLNFLAGMNAHQGVVAYMQAKEYCSVEDILQAAATAGQEPLIIICDEITDPHNLGAILRTAEVVGAHGVIIPRHRGVGLTPAVIKASAGAAFHINIAKVTNLVVAIKTLQARNVWIYGTDTAGTQSLYNTDFSGGVGLVVGSEGSGMSHLVKETCDFVLNIPMWGQINSLNASVAAGIVMFEAAKKKLQAPSV